jgi:hypothetical protein
VGTALRAFAHPTNYAVPSNSPEPVGWFERNENHHISAVLHSRGDELSANFYLRRQLFFTVNLAERRLRLLVDDIVSAKDDGFRCRSTHPTS